MDFGHSAVEQTFADEVRAFLRARPPDTFPPDGTDAGYGSGAHSRAFTAALGERGWLSLTWPREHGGQERPLGFQLVLLEELAVAGANGGLGAGERAGMATEVNQILEEVVGGGNTNEHGRDLLGGRETRTAPLTVTRNVNGDITAVTWNPRGVDGAIDATVSDGVTAQTNVGGTAVLGADTDPTFLPALLIQLRDALNTNNQAGVSAVIDQFQTVTARLSSAQSVVGSQLQTIDRATSANDTARTAAKAALSAIADADVAKVAVDLSQQEAVYQAALYASSQAIQPSLLEFLK